MEDREEEETMTYSKIMEQKISSMSVCGPRQESFHLVHLARSNKLSGTQIFFL